MWRLLSEELRLYRFLLLISWALGAAIFGLILVMTALLGDAKDRAEIPTIAAQLPLALLVASMVAGFIVTGTERSESRVRMLVMLPMSIRQIAAARVLLPTAMSLLGLLVAHASFAALLALRGAPFPLERHLKVDFIGLQLLVWVLVALVVREIIELQKARGRGAALVSTALLLGAVALVAWLELGPIQSIALGVAAIVALDAALAVFAFAMFCHRTDFTK
ncbi:MAG: hypothetical protein LAO05_17250 [Acidobacteriia bacterium]|nr:hypothetical protein [Terriglobia bacterium]